MNSLKRSTLKSLPIFARRKWRCSSRPNSWSKPILSPGLSTKWRDGWKWSGDNSRTQVGDLSDCLKAAPPANDCGPDGLEIAYKLSRRISNPSSSSASTARSITDRGSQSIEGLSKHDRVRSLFFLVLVPKRFRPAGSRLLPAARDSKRVGLDRLGDDRARSDIGAVANRDRGDKCRVRADEGAGADVGPVLGEAVVVAGDGSGADVGVRPDPRVADVGQMIDLRALLDRRLLDLDKVADSGVGGDVRPRP